ncbi:hypothetical protein C1645_809664 [Glomus cerebriforme]|uniref:Putative gamma-glutamylcyclotransferase n=1 Tax=Glomus cerebriforme TaxID=658196 RepID=A0A397S7H7_9GLOM|nr:hypothetical protein C1645_809664 [Glomus cerebriforme]
MGDNFTCFFYGTLIFPQILNRVLSNGRKNTEPPINIEERIPAVLKGYKRRKVIGAVYPAILKGDDLKDKTNGILLKGLSSQDIERLDNFEGDQYVRNNVKIYIENEEKPIEAMTYIWNDYPNLLDKEDWNPEDFKKQIHKWSSNNDLF